jgi:hypothetical protein
MTKRELVQAALNELGIAEYEFDVSPEELSSGSARLDSMMSTWSKMNLRIPYNYTGNYDSESGIPVTAVEAVTTNLAKRLAPSYGKQTPPEVLTTAKSSLNALLSESAEPLTMQLGSLPYGAGHKRVDTAIFTPVEDGTTGEWTGTVVDELVQYVTQSGDIDEAGVWYIQAFFDTGTWQGSSGVGSITVEDSIVL